MLTFKKNGTRTTFKNDGLHINTNENQGSSKKKSNSEIVDEVLNNE